MVNQICRVGNLVIRDSLRWATKLSHYDEIGIVISEYSYMHNGLRNVNYGVLFSSGIVWGYTARSLCVLSTLE